jgi:hypothetical protein
MTRPNEPSLQNTQTSKPDDIPQDVWEAADRVWDECSLIVDDGKCNEILARAILERRAASPDPAQRIGEIISEALRLAPSAGLFLGITIKPAKRSHNITNEHPVEPATTSIPHKGGVI